MEVETALFACLFVSCLFVSSPSVAVFLHSGIRTTTVPSQSIVSSSHISCKTLRSGVAAVEVELLVEEAVEYIMQRTARNAERRITKPTTPHTRRRFTVGFPENADTSFVPAAATTKASVGNFVGVEKDGTLEGSIVAAVGSIVAEVGAKVGVTLGSTEGCTEGTPLGATVGVTLGPTEGCTEGTTLGTTEGASVGDRVGVN